MRDAFGENEGRVWWGLIWGGDVILDEQVGFDLLGGATTSVLIVT
jgi:hypothetical protein